MDRGLLVALLAGLGGMLGWGLADFFAKKTIDRIGDIVNLVWAHLAGSALLICAAAAGAAVGYSRVALPQDALTWAGIASFGTLQAAVYLFSYVAFGKGQVAVLSPLFASYAGLVALVSVVALGEAVSGLRIVALAAMFAGILLVNLDVGALRERRLLFAQVPGLPEIAIAAALATIWTLGWNAFVKGHDGLVLAGFMYIAMTVALLAYARARRISLRFHDRSLWLFLFLIGACEVIAYGSISLGYAMTTHTSVVALISGAFSLPTMILARVFLRERIGPLQTAGGLLLIAAVAVLPVL